MPVRGRVPEDCKEVEGHEGFLYIGNNDGLYDLVRCGVTKRFHVYPAVMMEDVTRTGYRNQTVLELRLCSTDILKHLQFLCEMMYWARKEGHKVLIYQGRDWPRRFVKDGHIMREYPAEMHQRSLVLEAAWKLYDYHLKDPKNFGPYSEWVADIELAGHKLEKRYDDQVDVFIKMIRMKNWKKAHEKIYLKWKKRGGEDDDSVTVAGQEQSGTASGMVKKKRLSVDVD